MAIRKQAQEDRYIMEDGEWVATQYCPKCGKNCTFDFMYIAGRYTPFIQCVGFPKNCKYREQF